MNLSEETAVLCNKTYFRLHFFSAKVSNIIMYAFLQLASLTHMKGPGQEKSIS